MLELKVSIIRMCRKVDVGTICVFYVRVIAVFTQKGNKYSTPKMLEMFRFWVEFRENVKVLPTITLSPLKVIKGI